MGAPKGKKQVKLNGVMYAMLLEEMLSGPCTAQHLADYTGMATLTIQRLFRAMYQRGVIHIAGWERDCNGRYVIRVFGLGPGRDVKSPKKTKAEINRKHRERAAYKAMQPATNPFAGLGA